MVYFKLFSIGLLFNEIQCELLCNSRFISGPSTNWTVSSHLLFSRLEKYLCTMCMQDFDRNMIYPLLKVK